ncbi:unnamed protein product, partial [Staurois parvus]
MGREWWRDWQRGVEDTEWRDWQRGVEDTEWRDWQRGVADTEQLVRWSDWIWGWKDRWES